MIGNALRVLSFQPKHFSSRMLNYQTIAIGPALLT